MGADRLTDVVGAQTNAGGDWEPGTMPELVVSTGANTSSVPGGKGKPGVDWRTHVRPFERSVDAPAPTLDSKVGGAWRIHPPGERVVESRETGGQSGVDTE